MAVDISTQDTGDEAGRAAWVEEERSHIENATTDLSQFMVPLQPGQPVAAAPVCTLDGEQLNLADCWDSRPCLIVCGSLSCPPSRVFNPAIEQIRAGWSDALRVRILYVIDAHPHGDLCPYTGTDWLTADNETANIRIAQPTSMDERLQVARRYVELLQLSCPVIVDEMDNAAWHALGRSPNSATVIGSDGRVLFWQDWFRPEALTHWLQEHL